MKPNKEARCSWQVFTKQRAGRGRKKERRGFREKVFKGSDAQRTYSMCLGANVHAVCVILYLSTLLRNAVFLKR